MVRLFTEKFANMNPKIILSGLEQRICDLILKVNNDNGLSLNFYIVGGWTRDKILGKESDDIDVAIDNMTGAEFGKYLQKEVGSYGNVIKANPDQSKHLETMTIRLFGQDVDFVNLRAETYGDSRIPTMEFGDPETDANRRDLTINSIFYHINTGRIEDFTGMGLKDLEQMVLRTPMDPVRTFMDDPLRIMRLLRFHSRYANSTIAPEALAAMRDPAVQKALKDKVSPERVYKEFSKLFQGGKPTAAIRVLHDTGLWNMMFGSHTPGYHPFTMDQNNPWHVDNVFEHTLKVIDGLQAILEEEGVEPSERGLTLMAALLHDLGKLNPSIIGVKELENGLKHNSYHGHEDVSEQVARSILNSLKASSEEIKYVTSIVGKHMEPHQDITDKRMRKLIRDLGRNVLLRIVQHAKADAGSKPGADLSRYDEMINRVKTIVPSSPVSQYKPPMSGNVLMQMFPNIKPNSPVNGVGFINYINRKLQDIKDERPEITEQELAQLVEQMRQEVESIYSPKKAWTVSAFNNWKVAAVQSTSGVSIAQAYQILGLVRGECTLDDLKKSYRALVMRYHPDRQTDPERKKLAEREFIKIKDAADLIDKDLNGAFPKSKPSGQSGKRDKGEAPSWWTNMNVDPNADKFTHGYAEWIKEESERARNMYSQGYTDEQVQERMGYDDEDPYASENAFVASQMHESNARAHYREFEKTIVANKRIPKPEVVAQEIAAIEFNSISMELKKIMEQFRKMANEQRVNSPDFADDLEKAIPVIVDSIATKKFKKNTWESKTGVVDNLADMGIRQIAQHYQDGYTSFDLIYFYQNTLPEERTESGIENPEDVYYILERNEGNDSGNINSNLPVYVRNRVMRVAKEAKEYRQKITTISSGLYGQYVRKSIQTGDYNPITSPSQILLQNKTDHFIPQIFESAYPEGVSTEIVQKYTSKVRDSISEYFSHGMHDFEPDAGVFPYHTDFTRLETLPLLDEVIENTDERMINRLGREIRSSIDWWESKNKPVQAMNWFGRSLSK